MPATNNRYPWRSGCEAALITEGEQALAVRLALIAKARHSILAQYYSWEEDVSGKLLLGALLQAARRGVRVRLLVDDLYSGSNRYLESLAAEPNVRIRLFNPFWLRLARPWGWPLEILFSFRRLNHRMHNKLLVVDDDWALVGGRNIGDSYLGLGRERHFVDLDILIRGPVCADLVSDFLGYWRSRWSHVLHHLSWFRLPESLALANNAFLLHLMEPQLARLFGVEPPLLAVDLPPLRWHPVSAQAFMDAPGKGARLRRKPTAAGRALLAQLDGLQQSLDIVTPYLVPTRHFYRTLRRMIRRGCSARVLTNSLAATDMPLAYAGFRSRCARLLKTGLSLFELRPDAGRCLHAKLALFDRRSLLVGSLNLDPRSFYLNTEIALLLEGASLVAEVEAWLEQQLIAQQAWAVTLGEEGISWAGSAIEPETSTWRRALIRLAGWLPVHHLL